MVKIEVVEDKPCPGCGQAYPNRPKVADDGGVWWWRCYNRECSVTYYEPNSGAYA